MNVNATAPHQNAPSSPPRRRILIVGRRLIVRHLIIRRLIIRPSPYLLHRQSPLINPRAANQASPPMLPMPPRQFYPRNLTRPQQHEVDIEAFDRMWPVFGGAPPAFVRDNLPIKGEQMLHNVRNTKILGHSNPGEPPECEVLFSGPVYNENDVPSHVLAVYQGRDVKFFPVHQMIFAANCATLPYFPYSASCMDNLSNQYTLPVVKLEVPSVGTFHVLHEYLYTKNVNLLRRALALPPWCALSIAILYQQTEFIRDLWMNACALCVVDSDIYIVMQDVYVAVQCAIRERERAGLLP